MFTFFKKYIATLLIVAISGVAATAQPNITAIEYFFDNDPGFNLGTPVTVTTPLADLSDFSFSLNLSSLSTGMHTLYVRSKNALDKWSLTNNVKVYKEFLYPVAPATGAIRRMEYFIDTDPGFGKAIPVSIAAGQFEIADINFTVDLSAIAEGNHRIYIRTLDDEWGLTNVVLFMTNTALPVQLINFDAKKDGHTALLTWQTGSEQNSAGFDVERSSNGIDFDKIGHLKSKGNSINTQSYLLKDQSPLSGTNYYRLRQTDLDGRSTISETRLLTFGNQQKVSLKLFPNPATNFIQLQFPGTFYGKAATINICDVSGRVVKQWTIARAQQSLLTLPIAELISGTWHVIITTKEDRVSGSFIK